MNTSGTSTVVRNTSPGGYAVQGQATAATGTSIGVSGSSNSPAGVGVYGYIDVRHRRDRRVGRGQLHRRGRRATGLATPMPCGVPAPRPASSAPRASAPASSAGRRTCRWAPSPTQRPPPRPASTATRPRTPRPCGVYGQSTVGRGVHGRGDDRLRGASRGRRRAPGPSVYDDQRHRRAMRRPRPALKSRHGPAGRWARSSSTTRVGIATIAAGTSGITVTPGIDLTATSAVVATLQGGAGGARPASGA